MVTCKIDKNAKTVTIKEKMSDGRECHHELKYGCNYILYRILHKMVVTENQFYQFRKSITQIKEDMKK